MNLAKARELYDLFPKEILDMLVCSHVQQPCGSHLRTYRAAMFSNHVVATFELTVQPCSEFMW